MVLFEANLKPVDANEDTVLEVVLKRFGRKGNLVFE